MDEKLNHRNENFSMVMIIGNLNSILLKMEIYNGFQSRVLIYNERQLPYIYSEKTDMYNH